MTSDPSHDRDRGHEIIGTRITVYNLLPYFLDPAVTEADICRSYGLTAEQVAAARAYVLNNPERVLAQHLKIEERIAAGNPPEVIEQAKRTRELLLKFKQWLTRRQEEEKGKADDNGGSNGGSRGGSPLPSFRQWLTEQESRPVEGP
jgi:uncharacterized protein (DUF433 family)